MNSVIRHDLYGLTSTPFLKDPQKPFLDDQHRECLDGLTKFLQFRGFAAVAGRPGAGKTALIRYFTQSLHQQSHKIVYLPFTNLSENDMLKAICARLDTEAPFNKNKVINAIQTRIREIQPINPVIVLDEMQNATPAVMDSVRLLANDHFDAGSKMSCILIGTGEFFEKLRLAINESLRQRITFFCQLHPLSEDSTGAYIRHCLQQTGVEHSIFEPPAIKLISDVSSGCIRLIKQLAANAMVIASELQSANITLQHVQSAATQCILPQTERLR